MMPKRRRALCAYSQTVRRGGSENSADAEDKGWFRDCHLISSAQHPSSFCLSAQVSERRAVLPNTRSLDLDSLAELHGSCGDDGHLLH